MSVVAIERCLELIEVLAGEPEPLELSVLANRLGSPASAVHRMLATLVASGWVVQDRSSQRYSLSLRLSTLAFRNLDARAVPDVVQAVLDKLARQTQEYCRLAIVEGEDLVWVARAQGATAGSALRSRYGAGNRASCHGQRQSVAFDTSGKRGSAHRLRSRLRGATPDRIARGRSMWNSLRRHLDETRVRGFATAVDEAEPGTAALAVPFHADTSARRTGRRHYQCRRTDTANLAGAIRGSEPGIACGCTRHFRYLAVEDAPAQNHVGTACNTIRRGGSKMIPLNAASPLPDFANGQHCHRLERSGLAGRFGSRLESVQ